MSIINKMKKIIILFTFLIALLVVAIILLTIPKQKNVKQNKTNEQKPTTTKTIVPGMMLVTTIKNNQITSLTIAKGQPAFCLPEQKGRVNIHVLREDETKLISCMFPDPNMEYHAEYFKATLSATTTLSPTQSTTENISFSLPYYNEAFWVILEKNNVEISRAKI